MKITAEVRDYADGMTDNEKADLERQAAEAKKGMAEKSREFLYNGSQIYLAETPKPTR